jgi:hypothetical protein
MGENCTEIGHQHTPLAEKLHKSLDTPDETQRHSSFRSLLSLVTVKLYAIFKKVPKVLDNFNNFFYYKLLQAAGEDSASLNAPNN